MELNFLSPYDGAPFSINDERVGYFKTKNLGEDISPSFTALFKNAQTLKFNSN